MAHRLRDALLLENGGIVCLVGAGGKTCLMYRLARELARDGEKVLTTTTTRIWAPTPEQSPGCILAATSDEILERAAGMLTSHGHITAAAGASAEAGKLTGLAAEAVDRLMAARVFDWILVEADGAAGRPLKAPAAHEPVIPSTAGWLVGMVGLSGIGRPLSDQWVFRPQIFSSLSGLAPGAPVTAEAVVAVLLHEQGVLKGAPRHSRCVAFLNQADTADGRAAGIQIARRIERCGALRIQRVVIGQVLGDPLASDIIDFPD
jgi:probable selenium-dependent hydroxylase accessory protein YqeC